jgi:predicted branched-subunit amino acid permease
LYGAALEPWFRDQPRWFRLLAPAYIQDQTYLSTVERPAYRGAQFRRYWWWLGSTLLVVWTGSVVLGMTVGPLLPDLPHLGLVGTALFVAMLTPRLVTRPDVAAAGGAGLAALVVQAVAPELAILAGTAVGVVCAVLTRSAARAS